MKFLLILLFLSAISGQISAEIEDKDVKHKDLGDQPEAALGIEEFYFRKYINFLDSDGIYDLVEKSAPEEKMSKSQKTFYMAGFIRGLREYVFFKDYKESRGFASYHFKPEGRNGRYEKIGWLAGCKVGKKTGDSILEDFAETLGGR